MSRSLESLSQSVDYIFYSHLGLIRCLRRHFIFARVWNGGDLQHQIWQEGKPAETLENSGTGSLIIGRRKRG
jgi:hypothetical protein